MTATLALTLIRHGDAQVGRHGDRQRCLTDLGRREAAMVAEKLNSRGFHIDLLLASTAARAAETARIVAGHLWQAEDRIRWADDLYLASTGTLIAALSAISDTDRSVGVVGHNPGLSHLAEILGGEPVGLPTGGVAKLALNVESWAAIGPGLAGPAQTFFPDRV